MKTHSFVIRLWLEEPSRDRARAGWRGHITHYPSMNQRSFDDESVLLSFIRTCVDPAERDESGVAGHPPGSLH